MEVAGHLIFKSRNALPFSLWPAWQWFSARQLPSAGAAMLHGRCALADWPHAFQSGACDATGKKRTATPLMRVSLTKVVQAAMWQQQAPTSTVNLPCQRCGGLLSVARGPTCRQHITECKIGPKVTYSWCPGCSDSEAGRLLACVQASPIREETAAKFPARSRFTH